MTRSSLLVLLALTSVIAGHSLPFTLKLPQSQGGVPCTCTQPGGQFVFAVNNTGTLFKVDTATVTVAGSALTHPDTYGRCFFCWFQPERPETLHIMGQASNVLSFDVATMTMTTYANISTYIPVGWAGGMALPPAGPTAWFTGKYNVVEFNFDTAAVASVVPITTGTTGGAFEPLCGDVALTGNVAYFGSCTGNRTVGHGSLTSLSLPVGDQPSQQFLDLGPKLHWPFQVVASASGEHVYVFASAGVGVVDVASQQLTEFVTASSTLSELMCFSPGRTHAAVKSVNHWQLWSLSPLMLVLEQTVATTGSHSCSFASNGFVLGSADAATGLATLQMLHV